MHDSTFTPLLRASEPFVPKRVVNRLDKASDRAADDFHALLEAAVDDLMGQLESALDSGDVQAATQATWGLSLQMQPVLFEVWASAFDNGAVDGLKEITKTVDAEVGKIARALSAPIFRAQLDADTLAAIEEVYSTTAPQLINTDAVQAVIARVSQIAGDFADDTLLTLKQAVIAAIAPKPIRENPSPVPNW